MAVTNNTTTTIVDEERPCSQKLYGCSSFQWDSVYINKPVALYKPVFLKTNTIAKRNGTIFGGNGWGLIINNSYNGL